MRYDPFRWKCHACSGKSDEPLADVTTAQSRNLTDLRYMATILDEDPLKMIMHIRTTVGKCLAMKAFEKALSGNDRETESP
jgi:hypothetical protein